MVMKKHVKRTARAAWNFWGNLSLGAVAIVIVLGFLGSVYGLRQNNLRMVELRSAVFQADKDDGDIEGALRALRDHVINHMNADLTRDTVFSIVGEKPIQLAYEYYRDAITNYQAVLVGNQDNLAVLGAARQVCEVEEIDIAQRLSCVNEQVVERGGQNFPRLDPPSKDFYVFDFESPGWSPDLAGFSIIVFGVGIFLLVVKFIVGAIFARIFAYRR